MDNATLRTVEFGVIRVIVLRIDLILRDTERVSDFTVSNKKWLLVSIICNPYICRKDLPTTSYIIHNTNRVYPFRSNRSEILPRACNSSVCSFRNFP